MDMGIWLSTRVVSLSVAVFSPFLSLSVSVCLLSRDLQRDIAQKVTPLAAAVHNAPGCDGRSGRSLRPPRKCHRHGAGTGTDAAAAAGAGDTCQGH